MCGCVSLKSNRAQVIYNARGVNYKGYFFVLLPFGCISCRASEACQGASAALGCLFPRYSGKYHKCFVVEDKAHAGSGNDGTMTEAVLHTLSKQNDVMLHARM